jgi:hypothetical protein
LKVPGQDRFDRGREGSHFYPAPTLQHAGVGPAAVEGSPTDTVVEPDHVPGTDGSGQMVGNRPRRAHPGWSAGDRPEQDVMAKLGGGLEGRAS